MQPNGFQHKTIKDLKFAVTATVLKKIETQVLEIYTRHLNHLQSQN